MSTRSRPSAAVPARGSRRARHERATRHGAAVATTGTPALPRAVSRFATGTIGRVAMSIACGIAVYFALIPVLFFESRALAAWDAGSLSYLALAWWVIMRADAEETHERSKTQDVSRYVLFLMVLIAACASVVAIGFMLHGARELVYWQRALHIVLAIVALASSWAMIHTLFGFHYAHRYYGDRDAMNAPRGGLQFPNDHDPDYLDFAYYSFVVGMTSQVSDVSVTTRSMRRLTLMHGVLSFLFNIAILAMSINIIGDTLR
jgi:uncharacterized membrane protein